LRNTFLFSWRQRASFEPCGGGWRAQRMKKCCLREIFARFSQSNVTPFKETASSKCALFFSDAASLMLLCRRLGNKLRVTSFQTLLASSATLKTLAYNSRQFRANNPSQTTNQNSHCRGKAKNY
jgi:hypothetical protein